MLPTNLSNEQVKVFHRDGYLIIKNFCSKQEVDKLYTAATTDKDKCKNALNSNDRQSKKLRYPYGLHREMMFLVTWNGVEK